MKYIKYLPALIWMLVIFYFSSQSTAGIGHTTLDRFLILKSFHLIEYAVLSVLLFMAMRQARPVVLVAYLYALSDELHQHFIPGRTPKITDTLIDLAGIILGLILIKVIQARFKSYQNKLN